MSAKYFWRTRNILYWTNSQEKWQENLNTCSSAVKRDVSSIYFSRERGNIIFNSFLFGEFKLNLEPNEFVFILKSVKYVKSKCMWSRWCISLNCSFSYASWVNYYSAMTTWFQQLFPSPGLKRKAKGAIFIQKLIHLTCHFWCARSTASS